MSVISVWETHDGREGEQTPDAITLRRTFWAKTDSSKDGSPTVLTDGRLPALYDFYFDGYVENRYFICKRRTATNHDASQKLWKVEIEYEAMRAEDDDKQDPTLRPTEYTWSNGSVSVEMITDINEQKVENSVNQPFDPAIERDKCYRVLTISRNERTFSAVAMDAYVDTLNAAPIFGYVAREGRIVSIDAVSEFDPVYGAYWRVTYTIHFRVTAAWTPAIAVDHRLGTTPTVLGPWDVTRRNVGTKYRKTAGTKADAAKDSDGMQESDPVNLKANGTLLDETTDTPYWWIFYPYPTFAWFPLRLDS